MPTGALTDHIDVAQVVLYVFWLFFAALIFYLRREDRREGYPLEYEATGHVEKLGPVFLPKPKSFKTMFHGIVYQPDQTKRDVKREIKAKPAAPWAGAPLVPTGDPLADGVGPAAWCDRMDEPELTHEGRPKIVPMRVANMFEVAKQDVDPRGLPVVDIHGEVAGIVRDMWIDGPEQLVRYLEMEVTAETEEGVPNKTVLIPMTMANVSRWRQRVEVPALTAHHFAKVPQIKSRDQVTLYEEDRIVAYYAGGAMYAHDEPEKAAAA